MEKWNDGQYGSRYRRSTAYLSGIIGTIHAINFFSLLRYVGYHLLSYYFCNKKYAKDYQLLVFWFLSIYGLFCNCCEGFSSLLLICFIDNPSEIIHTDWCLRLKSSSNLEPTNLEFFSYQFPIPPIPLHRVSRLTLGREHIYLDFLGVQTCFNEKHFIPNFQTSFHPMETFIFHKNV